MKKFMILSFLLFIISFTFSIGFTIHYHRYDKMYDKWNIWLWEEGKAGRTIEFDSEDDYGVSATITIPSLPGRYGFIVRKGDWEEKDISMDRYINVSDDGQRFFLIQGDRKIYNRREAVDTSDRILSAIIKDKNIILVDLTSSISVKEPPKSYIKCDDGRTIDIRGMFTDEKTVKKNFYKKEGENITIIFKPEDYNIDIDNIISVFLATGTNSWKEASSKWKMKKENDLFKLTKKAGISKDDLNDDLEFKFVVHTPENTSWLPEGYNLSIKKSSYQASEVYLKTLETLEPDKKYTVYVDGFKNKQAIPYDILENYTFDGWLGYKYTPESTIFRLWSPVSKDAALVLYSDPGKNNISEYKMEKRGNIFELTVHENLKGKFYLYKMNQYGQLMTSPDPWAFSSSPNGKMSAIVDIKGIRPGIIFRDQPAIKPLDTIIYESHIRDLTVDENSTSKNKGTYKGFGEQDTWLRTNKNISTGIAHIKELGATHIHILPIMDFASVDETLPEKVFNWGYDPFHFFIPEGSYSADPFDPEKRISELKEMINNIHDLGLGIILDVVYNHTYSSTFSPLSRTVPYYYYRINNDCSFSNGSGCGNETASEHKMFRKHMIDSMTFFMENYAIDGFRFDLMALHDIDTMKFIDKTIRDDYSDILLYGEPWKGGPSALPDAISFYKGSQKGTGISVFNDDFRNAIKGDPDGDIKGFATGDISKKDEVISGIKGAVERFTSKPGETINYVTCHDNLTFFDKLKKVLPDKSEKELIKRQCLSASIIMFSQGIPFIHSGYEILRSKDGEHNSYNLPDSVNMIRWIEKEENYKIFQYFKRIISLRKELPHFKLSSKKDILKKIKFLDTDDDMIAYQIEHKGNTVLVCHNASDRNRLLTPGGSWDVLLNGIEEIDKKSRYSTKIPVSAFSTSVAIKK